MTAATCWWCAADVPPERDGARFCSDEHATEFWGERHDPVTGQETVASARALYGKAPPSAYVPRLPAPDWSWAP